ncbi:hypothetical protein [Piscirickettsia litoralis]|uniref:hypothetical protein n=1 Tax=Piscirickettsia litoralis TaxID=1891921 RepID=UPI001112D85F|nr:hypothetical protein [Piscirickettsia litoralis]
MTIDRNLLMERLLEAIELKKRRDGEYNPSQLARDTGIPSKMIYSLVHPVQEKRNTNPKIELLSKIVNFFQSDGFQISLDYLLVSKTNEVFIDQSTPTPLLKKIDVPIYNMERSNDLLGRADIKVNAKNGDLVGFLSEEHIEPCFPAGSIFIIDKNGEVEEGSLVAYQTTSSSVELLIGKVVANLEKKIQIQCFNQSQITRPPVSINDCKIIGPVVQSNTKS